MPSKGIVLLEIKRFRRWEKVLNNMFEKRRSSKVNTIHQLYCDSYNVLHTGTLLLHKTFNRYEYHTAKYCAKMNAAEITLKPTL